MENSEFQVEENKSSAMAWAALKEVKKAKGEDSNEEMSSSGEDSSSLVQNSQGSETEDQDSRTRLTPS